MIDLEFGSTSEAEAFHTKMRDLWGRVDVMRDPRAQIVELVENAEIEPK